MNSVFISHSRADARTAASLAEVLTSEGVRVRRTDELVSGSDWQAEILSAIRRCTIFVGMIDDPTPNVMLELGYALGAAKQVLLVGSEEARVPFDVASLPVARFDAYDRGSLYAIAEALRGKDKTQPTTEADWSGVRERLRHMVENAEYRDRVSPREFETLVLEFLQELGFRAVHMPPNHDGGYDMAINQPRTSFSAVVEVKKHTMTSKLGVAHVSQLVGAVTLAEASCGILVTTSDFSSSARALACRAPQPILLMTLDDLANSTLESITGGGQGLQS